MTLYTVQCGHAGHDAHGRPIVAFRFGPWPPDLIPDPGIPAAGETSDDG
jgi:hypothetical protein